MSIIPSSFAETRPSLLITDIAAGSNGNVMLTFDSQTNRLYQIELLTNLHAAASIELKTTLVGSNTRTAWTDPAEIAGPRYYRARSFSFDADQDGDALSNFTEYQIGTDLNRRDTDGDALRDGWEVRFALDPLMTLGDNGASGDPDNDGLTNLVEHDTGRNPHAPDLVDQSGTIGLEVFTPFAGN